MTANKIKESYEQGMQDALEKVAMGGFGSMLSNAAKSVGSGISNAASAAGSAIKSATTNPNRVKAAKGMTEKGGIRYAGDRAAAAGN